MRSGWKVRGGGRSAGERVSASASVWRREPVSKGARAVAWQCCSARTSGGKEGKGDVTRVVCSTLARRGKSLTPLSRIVVEEERRALVERREETHAVREVDIACLWGKGGRSTICGGSVDLEGGWSA